MKLSKIKKKLYEIIIDLYFSLSLKKHLVLGDKILLTSTDGIGDVVVRQKLALEFLKKHGAKDIVVLCLEKSKPIFLKMGFENIIVYTKDHRKRVKGKLELIKTIRTIGIKEVVSLEFDQHDLYIKYLSEFKRVAFDNKCHKKMNKYYEWHLKNDSEKVLGNVKNYMDGYFNKKVSLEEVRPDFSEYYKKLSEYKNTISIGIGANDRKKIVSPILMAQVVDIIKDTTNKKVVLLGHGQREEEIAKEILSLTKNDNIENLVGKMTLDKTLDVINSSDLYIGLDSGLYNFAFSLNKTILALFQKKHGFAHTDFKNVNILTGKDDARTTNFIDDKRYGTYELNNISIDKIKRNLRSE